MNNKDLHTDAIRQELSALLDKHITTKRLFTGYGLFYENSIFGIYKDEVFYLKAEKELAKYLESLGCVCWVLNKNPKLAIAHYYRLSNKITEDYELYKKVVLLSIDQIIDKKTTIDLLKKNRIKEMANLSIKYERLFSKIGIYNVETLKSVGYINAYIRLKKAGIPVNTEFLFNIYAALQNKHSSLITDEEKRAILTSLNHALDGAGLKKINIENLLSSDKKTKNKTNK